MMRALVCLVLIIATGCNFFGETQRPSFDVGAGDTSPPLAHDTDVSDTGPDVVETPTEDVRPPDEDAPTRDVAPDASDEEEEEPIELLPWEDCESENEVVHAGPDDYLAAVDNLSRGQTLKLAPGTYEQGLVVERAGRSDECIVIEAANRNNRPVFLGSDNYNNVIEIRDARWVKLRNLDVNAAGESSYGVRFVGEDISHVVVDGLRFSNFPTSGSSTAILANEVADSVLRRNHIDGARTGIDSGTMGFGDGVVIERNIIRNATMYALRTRPSGAFGGGLLTIRYNVFAEHSAPPDTLRALVQLEGGTFDEGYTIHGNLFYKSSTLLLFTTSSATIFNNVFLNPDGGGLWMFADDDVDVFYNTIVTTDFGLVADDERPENRVFLNAIFSAGARFFEPDGDPLNLVRTRRAATRFLRSPLGAVDDVDLRPLDLNAFAGTMVSSPPAHPDMAVDFDGQTRTDIVHGAFATRTGPDLSLDAPPRSSR